MAPFVSVTLLPFSSFSVWDSIVFPTLESIQIPFLLFHHLCMGFSPYREIKNSLWFHKDFPGGSEGKASVYNEGNLGSIPGLGRSPGEANANPLQYYCLENPMDRGAW